jgi:hypothetical protein
MIRRGADSCQLNCRVQILRPTQAPSGCRILLRIQRPGKARYNTISGTADSHGKSCTQGSIVFLRTVEREGLEHDTCSDQEEKEDRRRVGLGGMSVTRTLVRIDHECLLSPHRQARRDSHCQRQTQPIDTDTHSTGAVVKLVHKFDPVQTECVEES